MINNRKITSQHKFNRIIIDYVARHYANIFGNPEKIDNFLRKYDFPKLISEETENLKTDLHKRNGKICQQVNPKTAAPDGFMGNLSKSFKIEQFQSF